MGGGGGGEHILVGKHSRLFEHPSKKQRRRCRCAHRRIHVKFESRVGIELRNRFHFIHLFTDCLVVAVDYAIANCTTNDTTDNTDQSVTDLEAFNSVITFLALVLFLFLVLLVV